MRMLADNNGSYIRNSKDRKILAKKSLKNNSTYLGASTALGGALGGAFLGRKAGVAKGIGLGVLAGIPVGATGALIANTKDANDFDRAKARSKGYDLNP